ncbi:type III secretion system ATPase SctN [Arsenophonus nasoniae]|uniref:protein-secreting ATPase n=2 Tax=Arsenophonus nasoniae TaxID=638 RepID=A0A4P7KWI3_9GAMM|nr:type III secretion system ATPase SctN [Arsenophonus nasoniae]QBY41778.1 putative ATP synthase SpaL [Arsenophonus nasoniae]WGM06009.1 type III secretion system ATPase SctN [Arsenophonus nasoniae]WGM10969.1 type III secretion system ATPase SctN [Arsenophonus nasoniae]WGM15671.1 type III secretion system ATPase SctN [Arsenophonus nasoniae]
MNINFMPFYPAAYPVRIQGNIIEAPLRKVFIGEICLLKPYPGSPQTIGQTQVIGFHHQQALLSLMGSSLGLSLTTAIEPTGHTLSIQLNETLLGTMLDVAGHPILRFAPPIASNATRCRRSVNTNAPDFLSRKPITNYFATGIRAIDGLLTCGVGQRLGIFAAAGCGKTILMNMLINYAQADIFVIALIGERGREVTEFVDELKRSPRGSQTILISSTSDQPAVDRCNAALVATTVAEYFRDQNKHVILFIDSITRYCRALRDVALASGELPVRKGFPASVFEQLPTLLERPGNTQKSALTAFYTILLENEEEPDAIGDEIRSILDGHIYLSQQLAAQGHYPAIDILRSTSRLFQQITEQQQQTAARNFQHCLTQLASLKLLQELGEYRTGENDDHDQVIKKKSAIEQFLQQSWHQSCSFSQSVKELYDIVA